MRLLCSKIHLYSRSASIQYTENFFKNGNSPRSYIPMCNYRNGNFRWASLGWLHEGSRDWSWTCQRFCRYMSLFPTYRVTTCSPFPHGHGKPFCTSESIVPSATGVRFFLVPFCAPPRSGLNLVPFQSSSMELQNMRKLEMYTRNRLRYRRWYADQ